MAKKPTLGERLQTLETLISERHAFAAERREEDKEWRNKIDKKMDKLIENSRGHVTTKLLAEAITAHSGDCPARKPNPDGEEDWLSRINRSWRTLGVVGGCFVIMGGLVFVIIRLLEHIGG